MSAQPTDDSPNILLYVEDSLRADHLSGYGYDRETTPNVDGLAADGVRFENAFSQAIRTVESSASILTGLYPGTHGVRTQSNRVPDNAPRIAERLSAAGYDTAAFSTMVHVSRHRNFHPGFDVFRELYEEEGWSDPAAQCVDSVVEWLDERDGDAPFFAFAWSVGVHEPYEPRSGEFSATNGEVDGSIEALRRAGQGDDVVGRVRDMYDDTVRYADAQFGRLLDALDERDLYDETTVVFTADHGELLSEHGRMEHAYEPVQRAAKRLAPDRVRQFKLFDRYPRVGHITVLPYDELLNVPLVLKPADPEHCGESRSQLVQLVDLMPTLAEEAGVEFATQGTSLWPTVRDGRAVNDYVYSDTAMKRGISRFRSVRSDTHKYVRTSAEYDSLRESEYVEPSRALLSVMRELVTRSEVVLDVAAGERENVAAEVPDVTRELRRAFRDWERAVDDASAEYVSETAELDSEVQERLEDLGYM